MISGYKEIEFSGIDTIELEPQKSPLANMLTTINNNEGHISI